MWLVAVNKMAADVSNGNVSFYQRVGNVLTGVSLPASLNSIFFSASVTLEEAASNRLLLQTIGNSLNGVSVGIGTFQTIIAFSDGEVTAGDIIALASNVFGCAAFVPMLSVPAGITSAILGLVSIFVTEQIQPGVYQFLLEDGHMVTFMIGAELA